MDNVFGLDIGTRNVVGTVGYRTEDDEFIVVAQHVRQHETRSMLDGQIHDIGRVARTIAAVKAELEAQTGEPLEEVCIAAAGRVLKTVTTHVEYEYAEESVVTGEDVHTLSLLGIEQAQKALVEQNDTRYKFYCVGYAVVKYFLNDEVFISIEGHKANKIGEDIIVTFLPEDVVDGLYSAVGQAGLSVANMTLEPIAAINVAIPENYRMLNLALVDVGAGTSDISITREGSIIAFGMIPYAGDELTEVIVQKYLVDFKTAEAMKVASTTEDEITYEDIMSIPHTIPSKELWELVEPVVDKITTEVADKIMELNGGNPVSACFVVGGGGKIHGFTEMLAGYLDLPNERVALRGEEVLKEVTFEQRDIRKDPLLVTPIGICLNYYEQKNNFIMVRFNGERLKLYDNNHLTIVDAALQAGFPNDQLFPQRGMPINFTVNGSARIARGEAGEPAIVTMNGRQTNLNAALEPNSEITIEPSTAGSDAVYRIEQLEEYSTATVTFIINGKTVVCPKFVEVNGSLEPASYEIKEGDVIETRSFYTVGQVAEFMDVEVDMDRDILVNNRPADFDTLVYENFSIEWSTINFAAAAMPEKTPTQEAENTQPQETEETQLQASEEAQSKEPEETQPQRAEEAQPKEPEEETQPQESEKTQLQADEGVAGKEVPAGETAGMQQSDSEAEPEAVRELFPPCTVTVNGETVCMQGKETYIFVDVFDWITFDLNAGEGKAIITLINGENAEYSQVLNDGDRIELFWKEN